MRPEISENNPLYMLDLRLTRASSMMPPVSHFAEPLDPNLSVDSHVQELRQRLSLFKSNSMKQIQVHVSTFYSNIMIFKGCNEFGQFFRN